MAKKQLLIIIAVIVGLSILAGGGWLVAKQLTQQPETASKSTRKQFTAPTNVIAVTERPYVYLQPHADGRNISLHINQLNKAADNVEYELEYQSGSLLQGAFGQIALSSLPANAKVLLGSCSAGGACTYHEDVQGGSLLLKFDGSDPYALKQDWRYLSLNKESNIIASRDAKLQLESSEFAKAGYAIIYNTPGLPSGTTGTIASEAYAVQTTVQPSKDLSLTLRANEEGELQLWGYQAGKWEKLTAETSGKTISATVPLMEIYVATK